MEHAFKLYSEKKNIAGQIWLAALDFVISVFRL